MRARVLVAIWASFFPFACAREPLQPGAVASVAPSGAPSTSSPVDDPARSITGYAVTNVDSTIARLNEDRRAVAADFSASAATPSPSGGDPAASQSFRAPTKEGAIALLRPRFRACYNAGLQADSTMSGRAIIVVHLNSDGSVATATTTQNDGLSSSVVDCLVEALRSGRYPASSTKSGETLTVPVAFKRR